ncbi:hypothetical protein ACA910_021099 [Epithemia clementina (nom. ined.)]
MTAFFEHQDQMGILHETVLQMQEEGINAVSDLTDFDKDLLLQLADNIQQPGGRVPNPNPAAPTGAMFLTPAFSFGAKSQKRIAVACNLICYYGMVGQDITAANIQWTSVMSNFEIQL